MSFSSEIKNEICKSDLGDICCVRSELAGIIGVGAVISNEKIRFKTEKGVVAQRFFSLVLKLYNIKPMASVSDGGLFEVGINGIDSLKILRDLKLSTVPIRIHRDIVRDECCKGSIIRGAFLGGGSVSDPKKAYHAEITTNRHAICADISDILKHYDIYPKQLIRNGNHVLYVKESEQIENFLAVLGAHNQMMDFLNIKIEKEMRNATNRRVNCEAANVTKAAEAGVVQRNAIIKIKTTIGFESLSPELLSLAVMRLNNPSLSLTELGTRLGVTKSCVNHRMRKIIAIAENLEV